MWPMHSLPFQRTRTGFAQAPEYTSSAVSTHFDIRREANKFERDGWTLNDVVEQWPNHILAFSRTRITRAPQG